jgi:hypothetical protein
MVRGREKFARSMVLSTLAVSRPMKCQLTYPFQLAATLRNTPRIALWPLGGGVALAPLQEEPRVGGNPWG